MTARPEWMDGKSGGDAAPDPVKVLSANLCALAPNDREFAESLLASAGSARGLSPKQAHWVGVLAERAANPPKAGGVELGNVSGILELFERAGATLKHPHIAATVLGVQPRPSVSGPQSRAPGSITVTGHGSYEEREWLGRISTAGKFEPSRKLGSARVDAITAALEAFAADPAHHAAMHGHATGACCFCSRELSDARSVGVGYGPVCADRYGLPWGEQDNEPQDQQERMAV